MLYVSMTMTSIDIRRAFAESSVSGLPVLDTYSALMLGTDHRAPEDAVEARGNLIAPRRYQPFTFRLQPLLTVTILRWARSDRC